MKIKYDMSDTVYVTSTDQIAWPINKQGDSINIRTKIHIDSRTSQTKASFEVYLGVSKQKEIHTSTTYAGAYNFIADYIKDAPILRKFSDWIDISYPEHTCVETWFSKLSTQEQHKLLTFEDFKVNRNKVHIVKNDVFFKDKAKWKKIMEDHHEEPIIFTN